MQSEFWNKLVHYSDPILDAFTIELTLHTSCCCIQIYSMLMASLYSEEYINRVPSVLSSHQMTFLIKKCKHNLQVILMNWPRPFLKIFSVATYFVAFPISCFFLLFIPNAFLPFPDFYLQTHISQCLGNSFNGTYKITHSFCSVIFLSSYQICYSLIENQTRRIKEQIDRVPCFHC